MSERIDAYLVRCGFAQSRERAKSMIKNNGVLINDRPCTKPAETVSESDNVTVLCEDMKYVGRGALKLEHAFNTFNITVKDKVCADIGASTGGFTQVLLENGAALVYAVDVGHGQLAQKIAEDSRVVNCEGTNVKDLTSDFFEKPVQFMSVDLSFISLKNVMSVLAECISDNGDMAVLIKPQFEAGKKALNKKGIVRDKNTHVRIIEEMLLYFTSCGLSVCGIVSSSITGGDGNIEYLCHLKKCSPAKVCHVDVRALVNNAFESFK